MTGGSLGLRPWSNGLLQKQPQNGASQASKLQKQQPLFLRKLPKTLVSSSREKQRWRICRYFGRKKLVMYIVVILALLVFIFGSFTASKESPSSIISHQNAKLDEWMKPSNSTRSGFTRVDNNKIDKTFNWKVNRKDENKYAQLSPRHSSKSGGEPCKNFALPPPPPRGGRQLGPRACPVCYIPIEQAIARMPHLPSSSPVVQNLNYFYEENPLKFEPHSGSGFGGFPSLKQRNESFDIKDSMTVHCGFVKGSKPGHQSGFDIEEADLMELEKFHDVIVASAIFGNYDIIQQPRNIGKASMENVPFYMFVDEETESYLKNSSLLDSNKRVGLWRIIVVQNIPYTDPRRNGKVPKLLLHRLFPNVRYSIWIDGKLKLVVDPYQILERFLWRQNATFAISRHYKRFDVFEEAEANKAAGKYYNSSIDEQINFYVREGLTPYSVAKLPITSDVPEGCVIIREHVPITNLFTCLWFNEVDRFTSRDQLSFSTVRDKIMDRTNWSISMFLDCERRNFVVQAYHKDLLDHMPPPTAIIRSPPSSLLLDRSPASRTSVKKIPVKRGKKDRRSRTKRRRRRVPTATSSRDGNFFWV